MLSTQFTSATFNHALQRTRPSRYCSKRRVSRAGSLILGRYGKKSMIDRAARDKVILAFEICLDDQITAFEFDARLQEIESEDRTVNEVIHAAWFHYDDCKDHKVHLSKPKWDYFQRLLLILRSRPMDGS